MTQISENTTIGLFKVKSKNAFFEKQGVFLLALFTNGLGKLMEDFIGMRA
jgi:hypothetical protein